MNIRQKLFRVLCHACFALVLVPCMLAAQPVQENMIKAAFVYNFVLFTEWPQEALKGAESINVCVNAASEMQEALLALNGKSAKGLSVKVVKLNALDQGLKQCQVLYVDRMDRSKWSALSQTSAVNGILTISDDSEFGRNGAMVVLELTNNKMVFDINPGVARKSSLIFSSKLLRLARTVR